MKRLFLVSLLIIIALRIGAQNKVEVDVSGKKMSKGEHTAFTVVIPNSDTEGVTAAWRKYVNVRPAGERIDNLNTQIGNIFRNKDKRFKREKLKMVRNGEELYIRSVDIDQIASSPMDVYATVSQLPEGCQLSAFFQYTDSTFIDEGNVEENLLNSVQDYVRNFGVETYRNIMDNNIKVASKAVTREQNRLKDLQASTLREEKSILRNESAIQEFKAKISQLQKDSANSVQNIASKEEELAELDKDSADYMLVDKELTLLGKEKLRIAREIRSLKTRIKSRELDIESAKNQIASNELEIDNQTKLIENKQQVAEQLIREKGEIQ
jgi:DNA repair exonuclease SbcCD ATPase subunit